MNKIEKRHSKKLDALIFEKKMKDGLHNNPNDLTTNLTGRILSDIEVEILKCGLKHRIARQQSEPEKMVIAEDIWNQIENNGLCENPMKKERVKTALSAFTYSYVDIFDTQFLHDKNKRKMLEQLTQNCVTLKPDKGNGIVLINKTEYNVAMRKLFSDCSKFKVIQKDPTLTRLKTTQNYVNTMFKRNEISEEEKKQLRPMAAQLGRPHGLPKTHKAYANLPSFRPIIDTTSTPYYNIGKFLSSLLQPLTHNDYNLKDSFDAVRRIRSVPPESFDGDDQFVSFDVQSLFTNVAVKKTITIIFDRFYYTKLINTTLKKETIKTLLLDSCTKTAFYKSSVSSFSCLISGRVDTRLHNVYTQI